MFGQIITALSLLWEVIKFILQYTAKKGAPITATKVGITALKTGCSEEMKAHLDSCKPS